MNEFSGEEINRFLHEQTVGRLGYRLVLSWLRHPTNGFGPRPGNSIHSSPTRTISKKT